jgi:hypothetical protein
MLASVVLNEFPADPEEDAGQEELFGRERLPGVLACLQQRSQREAVWSEKRCFLATVFR